MRKIFTDEQLIAAIDQNPGITQTDLAVKFNCSTGTISANTRRLVKTGKLVQTADGLGIYHYDVPKEELKVTTQTVEKIVEVEVPVMVDRTAQWISEIKAGLKADLDRKVRDYLNIQYLQIMNDLTAELGL